MQNVSEYMLVLVLCRVGSSSLFAYKNLLSRSQRSVYRDLPTWSYCRELGWRELPSELKDNDISRIQFKS